MKNILKIKNEKQIEEISNQIVSPLSTPRMMMMLIESFCRLFPLRNPQFLLEF